MAKMGKRNIKGQDHIGPVVFKVVRKDEFGRPSEVIVGYDDTTFHLEGGEEFFTGYISVSAVSDAVNPKAKA